MGICGTAMASLAGLLKSRGFQVQGSDANPYPPMSTQLAALQIPVMNGYSAANLTNDIDYVIVGNVISASNPEAQELQRLNLPYGSLADAIGRWIIEDRTAIVVSGTHGKTTTTSLMTWIAEVAGKSPGYLIGGIPKNFPYSFRNPVGQGASSLFVIEGDEYDTAYFDKVPKFIHYRPTHAILTSVEFDHADIYKDLDAVKSAFSRLMKLLPEQGTLTAHFDDQNVVELAKQTSAEVLSYGFHQGDFRCARIKVDAEGTQFSIKKGTQLVGEFSMKMSGDHNILNATAAVVLAQRLGFSILEIQKALSTFEGVKRRQEILGEPNGVLVIEDFAHHPTAVRETIRGIQQKYPGRKLFSVFEPRSATSRRKVFQKDYVDAFVSSDNILIAQAFDQSKISEGDRFSTDELVMDLKQSGKKADSFADVSLIVDYLKKEAQKGDVVLLMSNGGFGGIYQKLLDALAAKSM
jgi:UDP-N-acetylmuramate: L-alanyl-gamma-D-glutamyl-meso-diaminopimelate ligase